MPMVCCSPHSQSQLSDESRQMRLKINSANTNEMVVDNTPINVNNVRKENVEGYVHLGQHYSLKDKNQNKEIQRKTMAGWSASAKSPGYLQKQPCHMIEDTGVQLQCAARYTIWCRVLDTHETSTEKNCGRTDQHSNKYAQHHIQGRKDKYLGQGENKRQINDQRYEKNEVVLGNAHPPPDRLSMGIACHHLETIRQETLTR